MKILIVLQLDGSWCSSGREIVCCLDGSLFDDCSDDVSKYGTRHFNQHDVVWQRGVTWCKEK